MATLDSLQWALLRKAAATSTTPQRTVQSQYYLGFSHLARGSNAYPDFIVPQLAQLPHFVNSDSPISVLEIGPGPKSVLGYLPEHLRKKIVKYGALEPRELLVTMLKDWFAESPLPCLERPPDIRLFPFDLSLIMHNFGKFDLILFCHSMYGMDHKHAYIRHALPMLKDGGLVVVFHRENPEIGGLACRKTASFPTGVTRIFNESKPLDFFAPFITGFNAPSLKDEWRKICRDLGRREESYVVFSSPEVMLTFDKHATAVPQLMASVPWISDKGIKNREAHLIVPAAIMEPTSIQHVQHCVQWARKHQFGLTVIGGTHSGHCVQPSVVAVDMSAFNRLHIIRGEGGALLGSLVVAEAGCKTGDIIQRTMEEGLTVPLGSRPSVGAGLWLQGGIGHLARLHGLACDAIVGAVMVSVDSGKILCIGNVPDEHQPADAVRPSNEDELLWALKGAGTNFGIVISVTFMAYAAPTYLVRNWILPLDLEKLNLIAPFLPWNCSIDGYIFCEDDQLRLGVTIFQASLPGLDTEIPQSLRDLLGPEIDAKTVNGVELFDAEMYMSKMHGGHGGGKNSSFKRCIFLKDIGDIRITETLVKMIKNRPTPLCYLHLLHGGEAVSDVDADATAFGCRDWQYACVVTAVWPIDQDETKTALEAVQWVYEVAEQLLPLSAGAYGADLGPDPRDKALAAWAFGPNRTRLAQLKKRLDPGNVLAYACPFLEVPKQKLIILVTGEHGAGKDYCAGIWASVISMNANRARVVSISDETKKQYAAATNASFNRLISDQSYKEDHRPFAHKFYKEQKKKNPELPKEHFTKLVNDTTDVDVLIITGMRDEAPLTTYSSLFPAIKMIEVRVQTSKWIRKIRRGCEPDDDSSEAKAAATFTFNNDEKGTDRVESFAKRQLLPFFHEDLERLASIVPTIPNYPTPVDFRHVLNIVSSPNGLTLCTSLLKTHFAGDWDKVNAIACCEAGGFLLAPSLAQKLDKPLIPIRKAGKLPPPFVSTSKSSSHISSLAEHYATGEGIEMNPDLVSDGMSVVVVDDVLASGTTLCAVLRLLCEAGARIEDISVMVVAEFPFHGGRGFLKERGFGKVNIQSLLVFDGK